MKRSYLAVTCGVPEEPRGRVVANIGRSMRDRKAMAVVEDNAGRHAASKCVRAVARSLSLSALSCARHSASFVRTR